MIRELGCSHIQGYIFGRPMNPDEAGILAAENKAVTADGFQFNRRRARALKVASLEVQRREHAGPHPQHLNRGALLECDWVLPSEARSSSTFPHWQSRR
jgi:hypothetical protein